MKLMDSSEKQKYRSNFGATMLFSGVQAFQILIRLIRSKFIAVLIGPAGMGITSLLRSTTDLVSASTSFGLKTSGVKSVAVANREHDKASIEKTISVLRRLILCTGLLGMIICAALAPVWSKTSFGNGDYTLSFIIISVVVLFDQLNNGELVLLQGMQQKSFLAKANIIGQTLGLVLTIPLYYFWGVKAIVWVLVLSSLMTLIISKYYTRKLTINPVTITWKETFSIGWEMIKLGLFLSLQFLLSQASLYIIRNFVSNWGSLDDVGLYGAGTSIVDGYLGLIFTAIATDYFPRLAATDNNDEMNGAVKRQAEISMLMFAPIVVGFIVFLKPIIILLYSDKFLPIENMMYLAMGATIIKALGWALSFTVLAKAKPIYFFFNEVCAMLYSVPMKLAAYKIWGLTGFGVAILVTYILYLVQMIFVSRRLFGTRIDWNMWKICIFSCLLIFGAMIIKMYGSQTMSYIFGSVFFVVTSVYAFFELNNRVDLIGIVNRKIKNVK